MPQSSRLKTAGSGEPAGRSPLVWFFVLGGVAVVVLGILLPRKAPVPAGEDRSRSSLAETGGGGEGGGGTDGTGGRPKPRLASLRSGSGSGLPPEEIVADRVTAFGRKQHDVVRAMATRFQVQVPEEVDHFFAAVESGAWDRIKAAYVALESMKEQGSAKGELAVVWPAVAEAFGVAAAAKSWPAPALLDYGQTVLNSLRPGMVYVAGTDAGRFIPALLGETGGSPGNIILPQNSLADASYLDYVNFLNEGRFTGLSREDAQGALQSFVDETARRAQAVGDADGATGASANAASVVSGPAALSGINERMIQLLLEKNPGLSFAIDESVSMQGLYGDAVPLGPILELRAGGSNPGLVAQRAAESLDYWQATAQRLQAEPGLEPDSPVRREQARMAANQGSYFAERGLTAEAERAFRVAAEMAPVEIDPVAKLARFLVETGRPDEAQSALDAFARQNESQNYGVEALRSKLFPKPVSEK